MPNPILVQAQKDLKGLESRLSEAKDTIDLMEEAGEDITQLRANLRREEARLVKWQTALSARLK